MVSEPSPEHPTAAGMYDFYLGGAHHTAIDRAVGEQVADVLAGGHKDPREGAWSNRGFLQRAARWLAEQGVQQFVDIGAGLPTANNTHDVVREVNPNARVLYVDNDPRAVSTGAELVRADDGVEYLRGDLTDAGLLQRPEVGAVIDLSRPVGLLLVGVLYFVADEDDPFGAVSALVDQLAPGSYLTLSHFTLEGWWGEDTQQSKEIYASRANPLYDRTRAEVRRFVAGLELVPPYPGGSPDVTYIGLWGAEDPAEADDDAGRAFYAAVARKP